MLDSTGLADTLAIDPANADDPEATVTPVEAPLPDEVDTEPLVDVANSPDPLLAFVA